MKKIVQAMNNLAIMCNADRQKILYALHFSDVLGIGSKHDTPPKASDGKDAGKRISSVGDNSGQVSHGVNRAVPPVAGKGEKVTK